MSIQQTDAESAAVATEPRVALADIEAAIVSTFYFDGETAALASMAADGMSDDAARGTIAGLPPMKHMTLCLMTLRNGFIVVGKSAPASVANFNVELGRKFAYEDAIRQVWPLMGFHLRHCLYRGVSPS